MPESALLEVCTDDRIFVKSAYQIYLAGTLGSCVTTPDDNPNFPRANKEAINRLRPRFHSFLQKFAKEKRIAGPFVLSHKNCGAEAAQGLKDSSEVEKYSRQFVSRNRDYPDYLLHITDQPQSLIINRKNLGTIVIPEGPHDANKTMWTVGGFATPQERDPNSFLLSADWFVEAIHNGASSSDLQIYVQFASQLTNSIMHTQLENVVYDAGRLDNRVAQKNADFLRSFLNS